MRFKKFWKVYLATFIVSLAIGAGIFCAYFFTNTRSLIFASNGAALSGVILVCLGGLCYVAYEGFFDFISYGFKQLFSSIFGRVPNENNDFPSYKEAKNTIRTKRSKYFVIICLTGLLYVIAFIILRALVGKL